MDDPTGLWTGRRPRHRPRRATIASVVLAGVVLLTVGAIQAGRVLDPATPTSRRLAVPADAPAASRPPAAVAARPHQPARPARLLTLVTRDVEPGPGFDRVYLVPGQLNATQARDGLKPVFFVRPGQRLKVRLVNPDGFDHTWTFAGTRINVTAFKHSTEYSRVFRAPRAVGSYDFFCAFRKAGMNGRVVVTD